MIRTEDFYGAVGAELSDYSDGITDAVKKVVRAEARRCKKDIQEHAPVRKTNGGTYRDSWRVSTAFNGTGGIRLIVNAGKEYPLTHLLEKGHMKRGGKGRVAGIPHIGPAAERVQRELPEKLKKAIGGVGK